MQISLSKIGNANQIIDNRCTVHCFYRQKTWGSFLASRIETRRMKAYFMKDVNDGKSRTLSRNKLWVFLSNNQDAKNAFQSQRSASQCKPIVRPIKAPKKHEWVENINEDLISKKCDFTAIWVWFQLRCNEYWTCNCRVRH